MTISVTRSVSLALIFGHIAGMIDLAALPVWIGTLVSGYGFTNTEAGGLATSFLICVVLASIVLAGQFHRLPGHVIAPAGYLASAAIFFVLWRSEDSMWLFVVLHALAGLATGAAISTTHGAMGKTANPHRIFAYASAGFGVFAVLFLGGAPRIIAATEPGMLFAILGGVMAIAGIVTARFFPRSGQSSQEFELRDLGRFPKIVWLVIFGVLLMNLVQAITFSFVERIGMDSGFGLERVQGVLLALGIVNLFPALIAAALQNRLPPLAVGIGGATLQAVLSLLITSATNFPLFAVPSLFFSAVMIFSHTFLFGFLAQLDPSGRANAATPAMTMSGSAIAPLLGGILSDVLGYYTIGIFAALAACITVSLFLTAMRIAKNTSNKSE